MRQNLKSIVPGRTASPGKTRTIKVAVMLCLFGLTLTAFGQNRPVFTTIRHDPGLAAQGHYPGSQIGNTPFGQPETNFTMIFEQARREAEQPANPQSATYQERLRRQCVRAA